MTESMHRVSNNQNVQSLFERLVRDGVPQTLAEMFALRQPPGTGGTDRAFLQGTGSGGDLDRTLEPIRKRRMARYKQLTGRKMPDNARYFTQLARFPGDPQAVVSDRGEMKRRLEQGGHGCEDFGIKRAESPPPDDTPKLDEKLVRQFLAIEKKKPENIGKKDAELREKIVDKHAYKLRKRA
jgi:hypothetical protein